MREGGRRQDKLSCAGSGFQFSLLKEELRVEWQQISIKTQHESSHSDRDDVGNFRTI